jgi:parallel beta-helix repeat protein
MRSSKWVFPAARSRTAPWKACAFLASTLILFSSVGFGVHAAEPPGQQGGTCYVSPQGNDLAAGTLRAPWRTLQHAANAARPGDTINVRAGTYSGFVLGWDNPQGGTPGAPITFRAEPGAIIASRNGKTPDGIDLEPGCGNIVIQGFTINNASGTIRRAGIRVTGSDHVNVVGNTCTANGDWGIFTSHSAYTLIQNNVAGNSVKQHGIYVSNSSDHPSVIGNTVFGNANCGIHLNGDLSQGEKGLITNALVENNIIYNNGKTGGSAINCDGLQNSVIRCNLLFDNHSNGIALFREDGAQGSTGNFVVNNTIVMASDARWALNINGGSAGNTVCNNILFDANPASGSIRLAPDSRSGFVSDYNIVENRFSRDEDKLDSLAGWRAATGQDKHSMVSTPAETFVNAAAHDFQLLQRSPAIRAGTATFNSRQAPRADLEGKAYGDAPDIGAYQAGQGPSTKSARR